MAEIEDPVQRVRGMLRDEPVQWTPGCPDPETLLDWLKQGKSHPKATWLLDHLFSCAFCRRQRVALREMRALSGEARTTAGQITQDALRALPIKVRRWTRALTAEGMIAPVASVRAALDRLRGHATSSGPVLARGHEAPTDLRPAGTAVRSGRPTLRWSAVRTTSKYEIVILQPVGRNGFKAAGEGSAGSEPQFTLPEEAELKPGSYLWQVVALEQHRKIPSALVGFVVLSEPIRLEIEALERDIQNLPLARIGLYEAYGLYEEALQQAETLIHLNAEDETARHIHTKLLEHLSASPHVPV